MKKIALGRRENDHFTHIFGRLILAFMGIILVPLFLLGISFAQYSKSYMEKDFIEKQEMKCDNMVKTINNWSTQMGIDTIRLSGNVAFDRYRRMTMPGSYIDDTYNIVQIFKDFSVKYDFLKTIYFYDKNQNIIFSSLSGVYSLEEFPDTAWVEQLQPQSSLQLLPLRMDAQYEKSDVLMYSPEYVLSWVSSNYKDKYLINNISCAKFSRMISDIIVFSDSFQITDRHGRIVFSDPQNLIGEEVDPLYANFSPNAVARQGDTYVVTRPVSNQLTAYLMVENAPLNTMIHYMYTFIYLVCGVLMVVFIFVAYFVAKRIYSPIDEMMKQLSVISSREIMQLDSDQIQNELQLFHAVMNTLESQKTHLTSMVSNYEHTVRNAAFLDYINGKNTYEGFINQMQLLNLDYEKKSFQIFLLAPRSRYLKQKADREALFHDLDIKLTVLSRGVVLEVTPHIYAAMLFCDPQEEKQWSDLQFIESLDQEITLDFFIVTCEGAASLDVFPFVFKKAQFTLNHAIYYDTQQTLLCYNEILAPELTDYQLPPTYLNGLTQALIEEDRVKLQKILASLFELLQEYQMNYKKCENVLLQLLFSLKKAVPVAVPDVIDQFHNLKTLEATHHFFHSILINGMAALNNQNSSPADLCRRMKDYLNLHYRENLNLVELSSVFQFSYPYLSKLFKEQEHTTLIDYLNLVRIQKAKELLLSSAMTLGTIAEEVGYNNVQSFQRFFKKIEGVTPGVYRQLYQNKNTAKI